ncbi:butyryl-CoA dehydrogenase [Piscinibacter sakaiensis]|uniref:Butyryl-CoA dehydrogenase n=1 Tax=Piscinibacter sakaiensis TaxID=1547922 RepID=A0A0K8P6S4_PISS1|nr:butyryl-CoA dehydrogenase [Piscinibacter sakaiensis]
MPTPATLPSDEERTMLRDSVRGFLAHHWPAAEAVDAAADPARVASAWRQLAELGLAQLCTDPSEGGLREVLLVMEELGRAACPVPLHAAALLNLSGVEAPVLADMRGGGARLAVAFAQADGDPAAGRLGSDGATVSGEACFVEAAAAATHFALLVPGPAIAFVDAGSPGLVVESTPAMGTTGLSRLRLDRVAADLRTVDTGRVDDLVTIARLCLAGRAIGAASRAFEMAVGYAKERHQFGQPIGRFQAVQHKLANAYIALQGAQLSARSAAQQHDVRAPAWRLFAAAATVLAATTLRGVSLETQHAFGAIGYSEEHEAPRHFKQVHLDVLRHGGARPARAQLAAYYLDGPDDGTARTMPEYDLGPAGNAFRKEVRAWLDEHWSGARRAAHERLTFKEREYNRDFARALGRTGWIGLAWPERFGGQGRGAFEQLAFIEEMERAEAPRAGAPVQAAMLQVYGTPEQQARYLPEILRGEAIYGMGYSEPDAGSDLASMRTRAVRDGDGWVVNGQKIWTTTYWGDYMLLATRTDPDAKPSHAGLSMFIVPMDTPGITVKTSTTMYGGSFANVFYDNVRLPADAMVGEPNAGWKVLTGALATERGFIGGGIVLKVARSFELLCEHIRGAVVDGKPLREDPLVRERIATLAAEIEAGRQMMVHCAAQVDGGETPPGDAAASKVYSGELMERFGEVALDILGMQATLSEGSPGALLRGRIEQHLRHSLMWVISIGTNEIQRSLIAQRGLGLPR